MVKNNHISSRRS